MAARGTDVGGGEHVSLRATRNGDDCQTNGAGRAGIQACRLMAESPVCTGIWRRRARIGRRAISDS